MINFKLRKKLSKEFIKRLKKLTVEKNFSVKINKLLKKIYSVNCSVRVQGNTLILENTKEKQITEITINGNLIEYHTYCSVDSNFSYEEAGKLYRSGKNIVTEYLESEIDSEESFQDLMINRAITTFNQNFIELSKNTSTNYINYIIENGVKTLKKPGFNNFKDWFCNNLKIVNLLRISDTQLIRTEKMTYYNEEQKKYNGTFYYIGYTDESELCSTSEHGEFTIISEEQYMDYMNGNITKEQLFESHIKRKKYDLKF